jgi:hypothetical protein
VIGHATTARVGESCGPVERGSVLGLVTVMQATGRLLSPLASHPTLDQLGEGLA